jgi:Zn ribbon nucleic-acid-binding protein
MTKREQFVTPVTCPECALNGSATWKERGDLETTIEGVSEGFKDSPEGEIFCVHCGVKAIMGKTLSRSEMSDPAPR